jgi:pimeloyl-ACP methyl ester carboxylesterase
VDILSDVDCRVPAIDLPGHGTSPRSTDPADYADLEEAVLAGIPPGVRDAVGFSAGGEILLRMAADRPGRFGRIAVLGVGDTLFAPAEPGTVVAALEGESGPDDVQAQLFLRLARSAGNDPAALSAFLRRPRRPLDEEQLARVTCPVLVVLGERDFVGTADRLTAALPAATLVTLPGEDHFSTPSAFGAIDAVMRFFSLG